MFGKRGEIPPLPRNGDARTLLVWKLLFGLRDLWVKLTWRRPTDRPLDIGKRRPIEDEGQL